jgi:hypothetical protein
MVAGLLAVAGCQPTDQAAQPPKAAPAAAPAFVGGAKCAGCHAEAADAYRASDHARAMQAATDQTVLGNFDQARVSHRGGTAAFFRRDGKFLVRTEGPDGKPGEFEITYTFGATPLQQYLVPFPDGRLQALGLAWDTRPRDAGGQRWFSLYPDITLHAPDPLHWTGREQTWNFQCAECHSTDLRKRYDLATNRYATTWAELTVSCEECHGPGSAHVAWAEKRPAGAPRAAPGTTGLVVRLGRGDGTWTVKDPQRGIAEWTGAPRTSAEVDMCARCHARRRPIADPHPYGRPFLDTHVPALLEARLYHADGQILGEVYEWGPFVQSRMPRAGVTCPDHSASRRRCGPWATARARVPPSGSSTHRRTTTIDQDRGRPLRVLPPRRAHTWWWIRGGTTVSASRAPTCRRRSAPRMPAMAVIAIARPSGPPSASRRGAAPAAPVQATSRGRSTPRGAGARMRGRR